MSFSALVRIVYARLVYEVRQSTNTPLLNDYVAINFLKRRLERCTYWHENSTLGSDFVFQ